MAASDYANLQETACVLRGVHRWEADCRLARWISEEPTFSAPRRRDALACAQDVRGGTRPAIGNCRACRLLRRDPDDYVTDSREDLGSEKPDCCREHRSLGSRWQRRQALYYLAICDQAASTLVNHPVQFGLERNQVFDFSLDLLPMCLSDRIDGGAGLRTIVSEVEEFPDLIEREAELSCTPDEAQPIKVILLVRAVVSPRAGRLR